MKKLKTEKGITLVALIITIVVVLILAVVAIGAVQDSNIIAHAQNPAGEYNQAKNMEEEMLENYVNKIEENMPKEESKGISMDKVLNKAYACYDDDENAIVYYFEKEDESVYFNVKAYDASGNDITEEYIGDSSKMVVTLTKDFDNVININVEGVPCTISNKNAIKVVDLDFYITIDRLYLKISEGNSYTLPDSTGVLIYDSKYDSKIIE